MSYREEYDSLPESERKRIDAIVDAMSDEELLRGTVGSSLGWSLHWLRVRRARRARKYTYPFIERLRKQFSDEDEPRQ